MDMAAFLSTVTEEELMDPVLFPSVESLIALAEQEDPDPNFDWDYDYDAHQQRQQQQQEQEQRQSTVGQQDTAVAVPARRSTAPDANQPSDGQPPRAAAREPPIAQRVLQEQQQQLPLGVYAGPPYFGLPPLTPRIPLPPQEVVPISNEDPSIINQPSQEGQQRLSKGGY